MPQVEIHGDGRRRGITAPDRRDDRLMLGVTAENGILAIGPQFVRDSLELPAFVDGAAERFVRGVVRNGEVQREVELAGAERPIAVRVRRCFGSLPIELIDDVGRHLAGGASGRRGL